MNTLIYCKGKERWFMGIMDTEYSVGLGIIKDSFLDDYAESNHRGYDLCQVHERNLLADIINVVDNDKTITTKKAQEYSSFLDEYKIDFPNNYAVEEAIEHLKVMLMENTR